MKGQVHNVGPGCCWLRASGFLYEVLGTGARLGSWQRGVGGKEGDWTGKAKVEMEKRLPKMHFLTTSKPTREEMERARMEEVSLGAQGPGS